jgi:acylphosphatase
MKAAVRGKVYGRVQGVGFRFSTIRQAEILGVAGWVANRPDGSVEFLVQGAPPQVDAMLAFLRAGPRAARVDRVEFTEADPDEGIASFGVR